MDIEYPEYPGCTVRVTYLTKGCNSEVEVLLQKVAYVGGSNCSGLYSKFGSTNYSDQLWLFNRAYDIVMEKLFTLLYTSTPPPLRGALECPNTYQSYRTYKGACVNFIFSTWTFPPNYFPMPVVTASFCSETACCKEKLVMCWDTATGKPIVTKTYLYQPSPSDCVTDLPPLPPGATGQSGCIPWCQSN